MATNHLAGMIMFSPDPERLANFYRDVFGLPFEEQQHGKIREHLECESGNIHFAILKKAQTHPGSTIVPSFAISDLSEFLEHLSQSGIKPLHQIINIGEGKCISSILDSDGNTVRLIQMD